MAEMESDTRRETGELTEMLGRAMLRGVGVGGGADGGGGGGWIRCYRCLMTD